MMKTHYENIKQIINYNMRALITNQKKKVIDQINFEPKTNGRGEQVLSTQSHST